MSKKNIIQTHLTENQIAELAQIGSKYLYLDAMEEGRISYAGIFEIIRAYEKIRINPECPECLEPTPLDELEENGGMCVACYTFT